MGCRAFLSLWKDKNGKEKYAGRFNIGATSINLPRIAIKNRGDEEGFYKELDRILEICKDNCLFRAKYLENTVAEMAPILWMSGALAEKKSKDTIKDLIWGGYSTVSIGYIGLSEVSQLLYGKDFSESEEVYEKTFNIGFIGYCLEFMHISQCRRWTWWSAWRSWSIFLKDWRK